MGVNKVDFDGETLIDLTSDTVTPQSLLDGYSAHNRAGEPIKGLAVIPSKVSELENDVGYATTKSPTFTGTPKAPTPAQTDNSTRIATTSFVKTLISNLVNGAPETLDTLKEIADALGENDEAVQALNTAIGNKLGKKESAVSAEKWTNERNINGLIIDGTSNRANYGTCSTAAATVAKTVSCTGFALIVGAEIAVKFTVTNTAANPTLNVNGTGAKPIYYRGSTIAAGYLAVNRTYTFRYNGAQYELVGDINTTYSNFVKSGAGAKAGLVPSPGTTAGTSRYLNEDGTWKTPPNTTYGAATQSANGLMSAADKKKLDGVAEGANKTTITNNYLATVPGTAADAVLVKELKEDVTTINGNFEALGERESECVSMIDDGANLGTAIWQSVCYITLPPGKWLVFGQANLINRGSASSITLYQKIIVETGANTYKDVMSDALGAIQRNIQTVGFVDLDIVRAVYLQVYSNLAGSQIYSKAITAVRIG